MPMENKACIVDIKKNSGINTKDNHLSTSTLTFVISSSCDVVYKERWLTQAGYWFILQFCGHFNCLSYQIQNAIKLENISNLTAPQSSYT